ncbi:MAG TPA: TonB-dependent receptor [Prolixibacteraceae bacterium]|nr:TonB-dependent receptor [Prolixibacteraceae bacterium]
MKRNFVSIIVFLLSLNSFSQTIITGKVIQEKGEPMPGVNAYLHGTYDGTSSNGNGVFKFKTSKTGPQVLRIEFMGYESFSQKVDLKGDTIRVNVKLKEAFNQLNAVTITAGTFASDKKQAVTITPRDMVTTAGAVGDVYGALQSLPGTTTNGESGRLFVKGGDSEESQTYIDGSLVSVPYNSSAPNLATCGRFNPFMFKGTIFSTGGYSAEYGQALSSVLLLSTNDIPEEDQLDLSFLSVGAEIAGTKTWGNGAVTGTLGYNNLSPYMSLAPQNYDWKQAPESLSGALSFRQKTSKTGILKIYSSFDNGGFTISQNNLNEGGSPFDFKLTNDNQFMNASWNDKLGDNLGINLAASYTDNKDAIRYNQTEIDQNIRATHLKNVYTYPFSEKFILKFGGEIFAKTFTQNVRMPSETHDNSFTDHTFSGFTEAHVYASSKFVTRIGGRVEYSDYLDRFDVSPRVSAAYKITGKSQFSAAYGWFYQNPMNDYLLYTNLLKPERADHYTLSFQSSANSRTLRLEVYYKEYRDLVKLNGSEFYLPTSYNNSGKGYAKGLDLFWRDKKTIKNGDYWISYSYLDTKRDYRDFPEEATPTFASKHNLSVVYKHWFGSIRSYASVNLKYSSPRVYNDPNAQVFNGAKMLPYRSLDLSWSFLYRQNIIFYGAVTNVAGFKNEFGRTYASNPNAEGKFPSAAIQPSSNQFYVLGCFITLTREGNANQLDKIE